LAFTENDELAAIDGFRGAVLASAVAERFVTARDVAYDPWRRRIVVFEGRDESGEIASYPVSPDPAAPRLGARDHVAWVDGVARVWTCPVGIVVFEDLFGPRWKVVETDGVQAPSIAAPRPASVSSIPEEGGLGIMALTYGFAGLPPHLHRVSADIEAGESLDPVQTPLGVDPATEPPTTRLVPRPAIGDAVLVDVDGGRATLRIIAASGLSWPIPVAAGAPIQRIEHAVSLRGGEVVIALAASPASLVAISMGGGSGTIAQASLALPGVVREEAQFFSRDLVPLSDERVLAATDAGVFAVVVRSAADGLTLSFDDGFEGRGLRGPLDPVAAPP
jgi:hypothetical protein